MLNDVFGCIRVELTLMYSAWTYSHLFEYLYIYNTENYPFVATLLNAYIVKKIMFLWAKRKKNVIHKKNTKNKTKVANRKILRIWMIVRWVGPHHGVKARIKRIFPHRRAYTSALLCIFMLTRQFMWTALQYIKSFFWDI